MASQLGVYKRVSIAVLSINLLPAIGARDAAATTIAATGATMLNYSSYSGATGGVTVDIKEQQINTGTLVYSLDKNYSDNYFEFDWSRQEATSNLHLLVTSDELASLGVSPIPITIFETGPISTVPQIIPGQDNQPITLPSNIEMTGGGTVMSGPLTGYSYNNNNSWFQGAAITINVNGNSAGTVTVPVNATVPIDSTNSGNIVTPSGNTQVSNGSAVGTLRGVPGPTPGGGLFSLALLIIAGTRTKARKITA